MVEGIGVDGELKNDGVHEKRTGLRGTQRKRRRRRRKSERSHSQTNILLLMH